MPDVKVRLVYQKLEVGDVVRLDVIAEDTRPDNLHALALSEGLLFHVNKGWPHNGYFTDPDNDAGIYFVL